MLLGGLTAADASRDDVRLATARGDRAAGRLPTAVHDAAAVRIGGFVYVFGGGTTAGTQSDEIVRVPVGGGSGAVVARLPSRSSDQAAAVIHGTAYVVGGYTGTHWLNTIVAWRPGVPARVVARLPFALRYAAVTAAAGKLVVAGGSLETARRATSFSRTVPARPVWRGSAGCRRPRRMPPPRRLAVSRTSSAGAVPPSPHQPRASWRSTCARGESGSPDWLKAPRSDLAAVSLGDRILLAGGRGNRGTVSTIGELRPGRRRGLCPAAVPPPGPERLRLRRPGHARPALRVARDRWSTSRTRGATRST